MGALYRIRPPGADDAFTVTLKGHEAWAMDELIAAGADGCTSISPPGPRWASYVHRLRGSRVPIERIVEKHDGRFPGWHARYVLHGRAEKVRDHSDDETTTKK